MKLVKIDMKLILPEDYNFSYQKSSLMQGALMEWIDSEYAYYLHHTSWNPYSQHLERRTDAWHWIIAIFDDTAYMKMFEPIMSQEKIVLKHDDKIIGIQDKRISIMDAEQLMNDYCFSITEKHVRIQFLTPTAFKQKGEYVFYPDIRCILQSMIHKYDAVTVNDGEIDDTILDELIKNTKILRYNLKSTNFYMEGVKIPGFIGEIKFGLRGTQTLISYIQFLFRFASYSGIGVKTAMGMGAIEIQENEK